LSAASSADVTVGSRANALIEGQCADEEVIAEVARAVGQIPGADQRAGRWVGHRFVTLCELDDDRLGLHAVQRALSDMRRVCDGVASLRDPLGVLDHLLDGGGAGDGVDERQRVI